MQNGSQFKSTKKADLIIAEISTWTKTNTMYQALGIFEIWSPNFIHGCFQLL